MKRLNKNKQVYLDRFAFFFFYEDYDEIESVPVKVKNSLLIDQAQKFLLELKLPVFYTPLEVLTYYKGTQWLQDEIIFTNEIIKKNTLEMIEIMRGPVKNKQDLTERLKLIIHTVKEFVDKLENDSSIEEMKKLSDDIISLMQPEKIRFPQVAPEVFSSFPVRIAAGTKDAQQEIPLDDSADFLNIDRESSYMEFEENLVRFWFQAEDIRQWEKDYYAIIFDNETGDAEYIQIDGGQAVLKTENPDYYRSGKVVFLVCDEEEGQS